MGSWPTTISCRCFARTTRIALLVLASLTASVPIVAEDLPDTIAWSVTSDPAIGAPVIAGSTVIVPLGTGAVAGRRLSDGAPQWSIQLTPSQSLAQDDERVYVAAADTIHAIAPADGSVAWKAAVGANLTAPPLARSGWVIAAAGGDLIALRATDGSVVWRVKAGPIEFRPSLDGDLLVASLVDGQILALDVRDGTKRWTTQLGASASEPLVIGGRVYVGSKDRYFYSLYADSGRIEDHARLGTEVRGAPLVDDRHVYIATMDNMVRALSRRDGSLRWHQGINYRPAAGPILVAGRIVVPGYVEAPLPAFAPATGTAEGNVGFGGQLITLPVFTRLSDGRNAVIGITGGLDNKWRITLQTPSVVPKIAIQPLTALPGVAVTIPQPPGR